MARAIRLGRETAPPDRAPGRLHRGRQRHELRGGTISPATDRTFTDRLADEFPRAGCYFPRESRPTSAYDWCAAYGRGQAIAKILSRPSANEYAIAFANRSVWLHDRR